MPDAILRLRLTARRQDCLFGACLPFSQTPLEISPSFIESEFLQTSLELS